MSAERVPSKSEVMGWNPQQLAEYLRRMSLSGCDKVVLKNSINGSRFVNLSDNDLQKFPKLHAPFISKISTEISKKEEKRGLFGKRTTTKCYEPDMTAEVQGWGEDEFDDEELDDDYESPYSGDEEGSGGDYETPNDDPDGCNDYEPPPSEPLEDHKLCPTLPIADSDYIDNRNNHMSSRNLPPAVSPRPPVNTLSVQSPRMPGESCSSKRDHSPHPGGRPSGNFPPGPPQIFRGNKPGRDPAKGSHHNTVERQTPLSWKSQPDVPDVPVWSKPPALPPSSTSVSRSNSSARARPKMHDAKNEQAHNEGPKHNTFPLQSKGLAPHHGFPGQVPRHGDSLPPTIPATGSLPHRLQSAFAEQRASFVGSDRQSFRPPPSTTAHTQELDPRWYVGRVSRGQAEGCLNQLCRDGAYLVRDSTRQLDNQPFTLMVYYQNKVYNIQIRQQHQQFLLGTGLKVQESFPTVSGIIDYYSQSPLLLIDAKRRDSSRQNQCLLSEPAGYYMPG